jgi:hypothetical protein
MATLITIIKLKTIWKILFFLVQDIQLLS